MKEEGGKVEEGAGGGARGVNAGQARQRHWREVRARRGDARPGDATAAGQQDGVATSAGSGQGRGGEGTLRLPRFLNREAQVSGGWGGLALVALATAIVYVSAKGSVAWDARLNKLLVDIASSLIWSCGTFSSPVNSCRTV